MKFSCINSVKTQIVEHNDKTNTPGLRVVKEADMTRIQSAVALWASALWASAV